MHDAVVSGMIGLAFNFEYAVLQPVLVLRQGALLFSCDEQDNVRRVCRGDGTTAMAWYPA
jgi:hypothetical protein